jgi:hypothetical protein
MISYYGGDAPGATPGVFNQEAGYYWWMAGAAWNVSPPRRARARAFPRDPS